MKVGLAAAQNNNISPNIKEIIFSARVKKIILDDKTYPELFKEFGEWNSLGLIFFEDVKNPNPNFEKQNFALPIFPNMKHFPLENEIVFIIKAASNKIQDNSYNTSYYYFTPINIWNSIHHNAIPDNIFNGQDNKDYEKIESGNVRRIKDGSSEINLGYNTKEKTNIRPLLPFPGDLIYEGRWGNSIRFSSTYRKFNNWSDSGEEGDPIIILRNGQFEENKDPWIPIIEDINQDKSSIYITSFQKIPIKISSKSYNSYNKGPILVKEYNKPQIIIKSGRLVFDSYEDHLLLSSKKSININAVESVNIDTPQTIIQSDKILLGDKGATEPLLLGNKAVKLLQELFSGLTELCNSLNSVGSITPYTPNVGVITSATKMTSTLSKLNAELTNIKSKNNYTI